MGRKKGSKNKNSVVKSGQAIDLTYGRDQKSIKNLKATTRTVSRGFRKVGSPNISQAANFNFYSPQLSTDFLELPQSLREKREFFRFWYNTDPIVGQAIDVLTELPLSKITLGLPKSKDPKRAKEILAFYEEMIDRVHLFRKLISIVHEWHLMGNAFVWVEDDDNDDQKEYLGWNKIYVLPIDQIKITRYGFTDEYDIQYIPSDEDKNIVRNSGLDPLAKKKADRLPEELKEYIMKGADVPMDTDPYTGSFCFHLARHRGPSDELGSSVLERCLRVLVYRDKLRQAQTSIASRHMTPVRVVWGDRLDQTQVDDLREQVDFALQDPDFSVVANYEVNWNEMGSNGRLLDLGNEYEQTERQLMMGLGVTQEILNGEATYGGSRITIEVMNTRFLFLRELIQDFVHEYLFKPVAKKKGFIEKDDWGHDRLLYPPLKFTRLALRDNNDTFEALLNLYQKGSLTIDFILELFNIDPTDVREKLLQDYGTINDSTMNELFRSAYTDMGTKLNSDTNFFDRVVKGLGLKIKQQEEEKGAAQETEQPKSSRF